MPERGGLTRHDAAVAEDEVGGGDEPYAVHGALGRHQSGDAESQEAAALLAVAGEQHERHVAAAGHRAHQSGERLFAWRWPGRGRAAGPCRPHHPHDVARVHSKPLQGLRIGRHVVQVVLLPEPRIPDEPARRWSEGGQGLHADRIGHGDRVGEAHGERRTPAQALLLKEGHLRDAERPAGQHEVAGVAARGHIESAVRRLNGAAAWCDWRARPRARPRLPRDGARRARRRRHSGAAPDPRWRSAAP